MIMADSTASYRRTDIWISHVTLAFGALAALVLGLAYRPGWGIGLLIGTALAWLNFRWLGQGLDALTQTIAAGPQEQGSADIAKRKGTVRLGAYIKALFVFRYALIALIVYVIFEYLHVPILSMIFGLCALGAATLAVSVHEILHPRE